MQRNLLIQISVNGVLYMRTPLEKLLRKPNLCRT